MDFILTPHQQEAFDEVIRLLRAGHKRIQLLGSAGCGKTVLASKLAEFFRRSRTINQHYNNGHVFVCAPTNKALAVLMGKIKLK
jgi:superfamily II DNA or RNA helicase